MQFIKRLLVGVVVGALAAFGVSAFGAIMSGKLLNPRAIKEYFGIHIVGELATDRVKRPFALVSRWCAVMDGITVEPEDYEKLAQADCVVLVERQESTLLADVEKELEALKA